MSTLLKLRHDVVQWFLQTSSFVLFKLFMVVCGRTVAIQQPLVFLEPFPLPTFSEAKASVPGASNKLAE